MKFHISKDGNPKPCRAKINCPYGDVPHFDTKEKAFEHISKIHEPFNVMNKTKLKPLESIPQSIQELMIEHKEHGSNLEILGSFTKDSEDYIFTFTPRSISRGDKLKDSGMRVQQYKLFDSEGIEIGYIKTTLVDKDSFETSFGPIDDYTSNLRYYSRYSGISLPLTDFESDEPIDLDSLPIEEKKNILMECWSRIFNHNNHQPQSKEKTGERKTTWYWAKDQVPQDIETLEADLKAFSKTKDKETKAFRDYFKEPFVDYSKIHEEYQGRGLGQKLYIEAAKNIGKRGQVLRGSGLQSNSALVVWEKLKEKGEPVKTVELKDFISFKKKKYFILDYR